MKNLQPPTILIAAGGTGGHIYPALAVAKVLESRGQTAITWLGSKVGMENRLIPQYGYPLLTITSVGLRGKPFSHLLKAPFLLLFAGVQTLFIFIKLKPKIVLTMGGFSSGLAGLVAWFFRVPLIIHEQNAIVGLTNRILARFATKVYQAFPHTFAQKFAAITVGNPIAFTPKPKNLVPRHLKNILVVGGSLGAKIFNETIPQLKTQLNICHQSGKGHFEAVKKAYKNSTNQAEVREFIDDMASAYAWADVVICRAGAMTISELMLSGSAAIIIPYPYAAGDHQSANAKILSNKQAAILLPQSELSCDKLDDILEGLSTDDIKTMAENAKQLAKSDSQYQLADDLMEIL